MASEPSKQVGVWVPESDKEDLRELAYERRMEMSELVRGLIQDEIGDARRSGEIDDTPDEATAQN